MPKYVNADELLEMLYKGAKKYEPRRKDAKCVEHSVMRYAYNFAINVLELAEPAQPETLEQETARAIKELEAFQKRMKAIKEDTQETHKEV